MHLVRAAQQYAAGPTQANADMISPETVLTADNVEQLSYIMAIQETGKKG